MGKRVLQLDGLRGFAIILVVLSHYFSEVPHGIRFALGWVGVDLFFVLSGFLMGGILLKNKAAENFLSTFYIRRICRIFPVYYLTLVLTLVVINHIATLGGSWAPQNLPLTAYLSFTQNIFMAWSGSSDTAWLLPTWTLAVEGQFYLMLPLLVYFTSARRLIIIVPVIVLFAPLLRSFIIHSEFANQIAIYVLLPCRWDFLFIGVFAAIMRNHNRFREIALANNALYIKTCTVALCGLFIALLLLDKILGIPLLVTFGWTVLALLIACYIILITRRDAKEGKIFLSQPLRFLGSISYGLYLTHQPVAGFLHGYFFKKEPDINSLDTFFTTIMALILSVFISWISWKYFELRIVNFGHKWEYRFKNSPIMPDLQKTT